jgi:signal transduction histidine kinase
MEKDKAVGRVSAAISGFRDLDAILKVGLDNVINVINGDVGGIMLLDEQTKTLSYRVTHNLSQKYATEMLLKLGEGTSGEVAQSGKARLVEDLSLEPQTPHSGLISAEGIRGFLAVPLRSKGKILGVINVASHKAHSFTERDALILDSIGNQLGIAVEQANLYEQLRKSRERYRRLAQQALVAQEEGRRKISRELQEVTSRALSNLTGELQELADIADTADIKNKELKSGLKKAHSLAVKINDDINLLIERLFPAFSDTLGLIPVIRHYAETNLTPAGINVKFKLDESLSTFSPQVGAALFRMIQGTISNIVSHSQAKNVTINLHREENELVMQIIDDGVGFEVSKITRIEESGRGAGLFSMKERMRLLGGRCRIDSFPGKGTKINVLVPLKENN